MPLTEAGKEGIMPRGRYIATVLALVCVLFAALAVAEDRPINPRTEILSVRPHMLWPGLPARGYADVEVQVSADDGPVFFFGGEVRAEYVSDYQRCSLRQLGSGTLRYFRMTCTMPLYTFPCFTNWGGSWCGVRIDAQAVYDPDLDALGTAPTVPAAWGQFFLETTYDKFYCYGPNAWPPIYTDKSGRLCCAGAKPYGRKWICR